MLYLCRILSSVIIFMEALLMGRQGLSFFRPSPRLFSCSVCAAFYRLSPQTRTWRCSDMLRKPKLCSTDRRKFRLVFTLGRRITPACIFNIPHTTAGAVHFRHSALCCLLPSGARHTHNLIWFKRQGTWDILRLLFKALRSTAFYIQTPGWKYGEASRRRPVLAIAALLVWAPAGASFA